MDVNVRNFDTLRSFNALKAKGVAAEQAEVLVEMIKEATDSSIEHLATEASLVLAKTELKQQIETVKSELRQEIADVKAELKQEIADVKTELKQEIAGVKADVGQLKIDVEMLKADMKEVKADIQELKLSVAELRTSMILMQRLFFGGVLVILLSNVFLFLHH